jgi:hypothetical protein
MWTLFKRIPAKEIRKDAKAAIPGLKKWFADHPTRKTCRSTMWYEQVHLIRRDHIAEDVLRAVHKTIRDDTSVTPRRSSR